MLAYRTRQHIARLAAAAALAFGLGHAWAGNEVVVIGHAGLSKLDVATVQRIYTGKAVEVGGIAVTVVNATNGSDVRNRFLQSYLNQDEDKYTAYWTVRRYIGKGAPPTELKSAADIIRFIQSTPGAIGYIDEAEVTSGVNVLLRK
jgi:ABC-type phosphate transport system substrate-binding protein